MDKMIGQRIKERRKALDISGKQIKEKTGISTGNLSDIENGRSLPSAIALIQLAHVLDCSTDYILFGKTRISEFQDNSELRESELQLLKKFQSLSPEDQEDILTMVQVKYERLQKARKQKLSLSSENNSSSESA